MQRVNIDYIIFSNYGGRAQWQEFPSLSRSKLVTLFPGLLRQVKNQFKLADRNFVTDLSPGGLPQDAGRNNVITNDGGFTSVAIMAGRCGPKFIF